MERFGETVDDECDGNLARDKFDLDAGDGHGHDERIQVADIAFALQRSRREDSSASSLTAALTSTSTFARQPLAT
jgi:hypothetical protein